MFLDLRSRGSVPYGCNLINQFSVIDRERSADYADYTECLDSGGNSDLTVRTVTLLLFLVRSIKVICVICGSEVFLEHKLLRRTVKMPKSRVLEPWWLLPGTEMCPVCHQLYLYETEYRCADCDGPTCENCFAV